MKTRKQFNKRNNVQLGSLKTYYLSGRRLQVDILDLNKIDWIQIESVGDENIYFTATDKNTGLLVDCFCKVS